MAVPKPWSQNFEKFYAVPRWSSLRSSHLTDKIIFF